MLRRLRRPSDAERVAAQARALEAGARGLGERATLSLLCEAVADNGLEALDVLYALTPVVDGHALSGRLLLGLPHHPSGAEKEWENLQWQEIGRIVSRGLAAGAYAPDGATRGTASSTSYDRTMQLNDDTVVTLDLVRTAVPTSEHTGPVTIP